MRFWLQVLLLLYSSSPFCFTSSLFNRHNTLHGIFGTNTLTLTALHSSACIMLGVMWCKLLGVLVLADELVVGLEVGLGLVLAKELWSGSRGARDGGHSGVGGRAGGWAGFA